MVFLRLRYFKRALLFHSLFCGSPVYIFCTEIGLVADDTLLYIILVLLFGFPLVFPSPVEAEQVIDSYLVLSGLSPL